MMTMKRMKRTYLPPISRTVLLSPDVLLGSSDLDKRGYAIDNDEHSNDNIIDVGRQSDLNFWELD